MECEQDYAEENDEVPVATEALYDEVVVIIFFIEIFYSGVAMPCIIEPFVEGFGSLQEFDADEIVECGGGAEEEIPADAQQNVFELYGDVGLRMDHEHDDGIIEIVYDKQYSEKQGDVLFEGAYIYIFEGGGDGPISLKVEDIVIDDENNCEVDCPDLGLIYIVVGVKQGCKQAGENQGVRHYRNDGSCPEAMVGGYRK